MGLSKEDQALHEAVKSGKVDDVKAALKGADVNASEMFDGSSLNLAARLGKADIVKVLIDAGADIEHKDPADMTPLTQAAVAGHVETCDVLLAAGAKITNDLAMSVEQKLRILEENAAKGMVKSEAVAAWKAFIDKLKAASRKQ
jgi:ankyrin repeat protein